MDPRERIRHAFATRQDRLPGTVFTGLEQLRLRPLHGDGVYRELEALLEGLHEDGVLGNEAFDTARARVEALPLGGSPTPRENRHD
ncbi:hypothetical protein SAMN04244573_03791 [Azotobacter beijerinckii]|uniref:Uncharacterized protein n=1 Tax=Azotobacter beijerinckii TaxID=170623 RepID=A0A1H7A6Q2_9GAMM|nr:hypothetical protein [Azotobacter beijerinckii]SEJ57692.1 hypothetical protein SAMN04244579_04839 [Azotobacter beijerinckii]SER52465.1 hypothetical protein SAMN04244573_03791 [Azotobacter beijerinckii]